MEFIIGGKKYKLTLDEIRCGVRNLEPEPVKKYYVEIDGKNYPIKQVISEILGIPRIIFTSMYAYGVLERLGIKVKTRNL